MAGGGFTLKIASTPIVSVTSTCSARAKSDPPQPHQAPRRVRRSPFCARGEAKVSCGPRSGVGGGVRKTGGCRIRQGLGSASGLGSGQVWACGNFSTGFPPAQRRCIGASGSEPPGGSSVHPVRSTAPAPDESALTTLLSQRLAANWLVEDAAARPLTPATGRGQQLPEPTRASAAASADSLAPLSSPQRRRSRTGSAAAALSRFGGAKCSFGASNTTPTYVARPDTPSNARTRKIDLSVSTLIHDLNTTQGHLVILD